jgi:lipopolysaccharide transport system permease protein
MNRDYQKTDSGVIEINAVKGWVPLNLIEIWHYRDLLFFFLWRDLKGRYRQMALGPLWIIIGPVVNMLLFTVIFGKLAGLGPEGVPYPLFNYSALLVWGLFSGVAQSSASSLLDSRYLISKVYFPRLVMPLVGILTTLVNFFVSLLVLVALMVYYGRVPGSEVAMLPVFILLAVVCGLAVGLWWASWIVHYRDLQMVLDYLMKAWMYACPVVYVGTIIPSKWQFLYHLNPMVDIVEGMRWSLLGMDKPQWSLVLLSFAVMIPLLIGGLYYFRKTERNIVDIA